MIQFSGKSYLLWVKMILFGVYSSYRISAVLLYFNVITVRVMYEYATVCVAGPAHGCLPQSADQDTTDAE